MNDANYTQLITKLDAFVRKYYKNQLLRGGVYFALATLLAFLLVVVLEYFGRYSNTVRAVLFYSFLSFAVYCLVRFVVVPLLGMYRLGKVMSYEQASALIGRHFPDVKDRLLNTLQLKHEAGKHDSMLLEAAINQKVAQLNPVPFTDAVNLKQNLKHARLVLIPIGVYAVIYFFAPGIITAGSERLVKYNQTFVPQAPFEFVVLNHDLKTPQFTDFELRLNLTGNSLPAEVYVETGGQQFKMQRTDNTHFTYTFRNVNKDVPFNFIAADYASAEYNLKVVAKPAMINYQVKLDYPAYIGKEDEVVQNPGDLNIPAGTTVSWSFLTAQTEQVMMGFGQQEVSAVKKDNTRFGFEKRFLLSTPYYIKSSNSSYGVADSMAYLIQVNPDAYPAITVDEKADSLTGKQLYFIGDAADDYGLTKLVFVYRFLKSEQEVKMKQGAVIKPIAIQQREKSQRFYFQFNLNETGLEAADELEYYFEVWDNDGVRGAKSARSKTMMFRAPSEKELRRENDMAGKSLKDDMKEAMRESQQLQKELKELQMKMLEKRDLTWEEKKKAEDLLKRQKELVQKLEDIKKQNEKNNLRENEFKQPDPELLQKQQQIEKMFNELMNDELKKLMREMEQLLQQQNKDAVKQEMDKLQMNNKDVEKELDRLLEQFKQLELDKKLTETTKELEKLAQEQKDLAQKTKDIEQNKQLSKADKQQKLDAVKKEQQQLKQEFKDLQQELRDIEQKNNAMEEPRDMADTKQAEQKVNEEMKKAEENLEKKDGDKAGENQEKAGEEMEKMAEKIREKQEEQEKEQHEEDAATLREILENTIQLSKDQEALIEQMKTINGYSPQYVELAKQQKITRDNARIIEDSLLALSKRVPEISSFINREVTKMNDNLEKSVAGFGVRNFMEIRTRQQYAMTHANNLAVMLSQVLNQVQQQNQQAKSKKGGKGKPKPGKGQGNKPLTMSQIKKMQEELNKQLKEGMNKQDGKEKEGNGSCPNPGGQKPGQQGNQQGNKQGQSSGNQPNGQQQGMGSEGFARMAAQQMAIRQQLQKMMQQMDAKQKEGLGGAKQLEEMKRLMEQTEKELFNKKLTTEMLQRQQDILTRLLESEKAERKQEQEEKREAEQAKEKPKTSPPAFDLYIQQKNREKELLETIPPDMQPYYKEKSKQYFNRIGNETR